jgi:hypothetical protein
MCPDGRIEMEILLLFPLKSKRLKRIAGLAPKKDLVL